MTKDEEKRAIARARERADLARLRFGNAANDVLDRLHPDKLRAEAIEIATEQLDQAKNDLLARFRHWPALLGAIAAAALALIFWQPARMILRQGMRIASLVWATRDLWRRKA